MRLRRVPWFGLVALAAASGSLVSAEASAEWPPPESTTAKDMPDPKYWPNDPDYGYTKDSDGQWEHYSFVPTPSGSIMPRPEETQAGMAIDLAWRHTIGDDNVRIAITDSGIEWDREDLLERAWLNPKELEHHKPLHADSSACDGTGELAGFDCNGDGILTVSDYKDTPSLAPEATMGHPKGDKNQNGVLDAGDLILNYSDGVDDDQNGYIDDISGWDFMKDDNDPYDDTRYGHGTGEANDSVASANNGIGAAGGCPNCRFIPMRVGDSFITDVSDFGQAVIYATDAGAKVIQCALGTINNNHFSQAALDYAYDKGVLTITSMADENSRHHNVPAASNHTLPVHAIEYDGTRVTASTTFVQFHPCSNFGGQNLLSASGTACSSEATGQLSGIAGLVYSAALKYGINPPLTPGEAQSIFFTTADDIDVAESRQPDAHYRWSQKGFDQRFGYGRVNANRAVEAIRDHRIPPAVDVTSPTWFTVLYKDRVTGPVDIVGTVSAKRANSYDYTVEWGPGVQPLDEEFKTIASAENVHPDVVTGKDGTPLASIDIRSIDPTHPRDVDSQHGENDTTITVRVRSVAHYGGMVGDVPGEMRRTYYVHQDPDLLKGFPIHIGESGEGNPKMADLDGDGVRELIYPTGGGAVHALKMGPEGPAELAGFPYMTATIDGLSDTPAPGMPVYLGAAAYTAGKNGGVDPSIAHESITNAPAIADLDGDGKPEIVVSTYPGGVYVIEPDGTARSGWPKRLPDIPSCPLDHEPDPNQPCMTTSALIARGAFASPVLVDLDKDGKLDIVQAAFDGSVYAFDASGAAVPGWPVRIHYKGKLSPEPNRNRILTTPAIADFNGDGIPDLLVGSNERLGQGGQSGGLYILDGRGTNTPGGNPVLPNWPVTTTSFQLFPLVAEGVPNSGVIGRFDGKLAAVMHGNASLPLILPVDPGKQTSINGPLPNQLPVRPDPDDPAATITGVDPASIFGPLTKADRPNTFLPLFAQPSLGDVDQDGTPDVIASGGSLALAIALQSSSGQSSLKGGHLLAMWSGKTGSMLPASPYVLEDYTFFNSQAVADINGDNYPEVITGSGGYFVHAFDGCGREPEGWPKFTGQWVIPTAAVGDIDGDKKLEVVVGTRDGWLYAWHTQGTEGSVIEWESFHHDNRNTGNLETPLGQGGKQKADKPLTADMCAVAEPTPTSSEQAVGGGCACDAAGRGNGSNRAALAFVVGLALVAVRRRSMMA